MLHACKIATYQPIDVWRQVRDLSVSRDNLERHPSSRGDHHHAASCYGGRCQCALMAADIYSAKCSQIFWCVHAVYQPSLQPKLLWVFFFFWFGLFQLHTGLHYNKVLKNITLAHVLKVLSYKLLVSMHSSSLQPKCHAMQ